MFTFNKTVVCIEFSKTTVFCALAQITGRKVDIISIDSIQIESGILEEGIIYDTPHLQHIVKNLITSVSRNQTQIDCAWISIPDNKTLITKFEVEKDKKGIREEDIHKSIEEKFNHSASKLYLINRPIHEINRRVFFVSTAVRIEHLEPFIELFEPLNIPIESVFPTFQCIFEETKENFNVPTLLLYPTKKGFKFFLADTNGVYLESVWGHNVIEFNENFDKAINEVIQYAKQSKEVALGVKKIVIVESANIDSDLLQNYLQKIGLEWSWINNKAENDDFDPVSVLILKGLIKAAMAKGFNKGFLEPQITHLDEVKSFSTAPSIKSPAPAPTPVAAPQVVTANENVDIWNNSYTTQPTRNTITKDMSSLENKWNTKVLVSSLVLGIALLGLMFYTGTKIAGKTTKPNQPTESLSTAAASNNEPEVTVTPSTTVTATPTSTPSPTPTKAPSLAKDQVKVLVLNGNNVAGEAAKINVILKNNGFTTKTPGNSPTKGIASTSVTYKNPAAQEIAEEIAKLIEPNYASAKAVLDTGASEDILVLLGAR